MIEQKLEKLNTLTIEETQLMFLEYFNHEPPQKSKDYYVLNIA